ncbi:Protein FANTASTIC FOUR 3 [Linum perenne]
MGTIVYQGLQSCLESQIAESRTLRLRLSAPNKPPTSLSSSSGAWGSIQTLSDQTNFLKPAQPMLQRCVSASLSDKSLELCTENLGSETGADQQLSDLNDNNYLFSSPSSEGIGYSDEKAAESRRVHTVAVTKSRTARRRNVNGDGNGFPPPLTTMAGPELIRVRPHREGGRLVMKAVMSQSAPSCFQAERIDSRLRLHVLVDRSDYSDTAFDSAIVTECNHNNNNININNNIGDEDDNNININYAEENEIREEEGMETMNRSCKEEEEGSYQNQQHHENVNKGGLAVLNWGPFRIATVQV